MNSKRSLFHTLLILLVAISLTGCFTNPNTSSIVSRDNHFMSMTSTIHLKPYSVTGQVLNQQGVPVQDCQVYLVKRTINPASNEEDNIKLLKQNHIVDTDSEGQYFLTFEPGESNDLWLTFVDRLGLYDPRSVRLNEKMGNSLLEYPGNNPIYINVVLEK
ncbi:MAG: hypothetical protein RBR67_14320 [Desulfobacterium sp.]|nr:hypothetical protein [Desulfobacterium sp.]